MTPIQITFKQCANCHERDLAHTFTFGCCGSCATAYIKGFVCGVALLTGFGLIGLVLRAAMGLW